jgi:hypothetical protein
MKATEQKRMQFLYSESAHTIISYAIFAQTPRGFLGHKDFFRKPGVRESKNWPGIIVVDVTAKSPDDGKEKAKKILEKKGYKVETQH